jgi:hypothetical protein
MNDRSIERYFDRLMHEYYLVGINAFGKQVREAARLAIGELVNIPVTQRLDEKLLSDLEFSLRQKLGEDFANAMYQKTRTFTDACYRLSARESQFQGRNIKINTNDLRYIELIKKQQIFWLKEHYNSSISKKLQEILIQSIEKQWPAQQLASELKINFETLPKGSDHYFLGLSQHTGLRVREFGRLTAYKKCGVKQYQIHAILDDRTSEICIVLDGQIFDLEPALDLMEAMLEEPDYQNPEEAKARLMRLAPFVKDDQIVYDNENNPLAISGDHGMFPPFHWKCRSKTVMV